MGAVCILLALATYALLRRSFSDLSRTIPGGRLGLVFRRLFFPGFVLAALTGFFSVTFQSCDKQTYAGIIADRSFLVAKNQEQLRSSLLYTCTALLVWGVIVIVALLSKKKKEDRNVH